jgi:hypothetical protein
LADTWAERSGFAAVGATKVLRSDDHFFMLAVQPFVRVGSSGQDPRGEPCVLVFRNGHPLRELPGIVADTMPNGAFVMIHEERGKKFVSFYTADGHKFSGPNPAGQGAGAGGVPEIEGLTPVAASDHAPPIQDIYSRPFARIAFPGRLYRLPDGRTLWVQRRPAEYAGPPIIASLHWVAKDRETVNSEDVTKEVLAAIKDNRTPELPPIRDERWRVF